MTHTGLILKERPSEAWLAGSGKAGRRFGGADLNLSGKWSSYIPPFEAQSRTGFDPQSCALEHTIRAWITLAEFLGFNDFLPDGAERYLGVFAGTTPQGTDPYVVSDMARRICGLIPQEEMPWTDQTTFDSYYDQSIAKSLLPFGKALLDRFDLGHQDLWAYGAKLTPQEKAALIETYLKRGTVCVSISGNYRTKNGRLYKEDAEHDTHWVLLSEMDAFVDSYLPEEKKLVKDYNHEMATVYFLQRRTNSSTSFWSIIWDNFRKLWAS